MHIKTNYVIITDMMNLKFVKCLSVNMHLMVKHLKVHQKLFQVTPVFLYCSTSYVKVSNLYCHLVSERWYIDTLTWLTKLSKTSSAHHLKSKELLLRPTVAFFDNIFPFTDTIIDQINLDWTFLRFTTVGYYQIQTMSSTVDKVLCFGVFLWILCFMLYNSPLIVLQPLYHEVL